MAQSLARGERVTLSKVDAFAGAWQRLCPPRIVLQLLCTSGCRCGPLSSTPIVLRLQMKCRPLRGHCGVRTNSSHVLSQLTDRRWRGGQVCGRRDVPAVPRPD